MIKGGLIQLKTLKRKTNDEGLQDRVRNYNKINKDWVTRLRQKL